MASNKIITSHKTKIYFIYICIKLSFQCLWPFLTLLPTTLFWGLNFLSFPGIFLLSLFLKPASYLFLNFLIGFLNLSLFKGFLIIVLLPPSLFNFFFLCNSENRFSFLFTPCFHLPANKSKNNTKIWINYVHNYSQ